MVDIPKFWTWATVRLRKRNFMRKWENNDRIRKLVKNVVFTGWGEEMSEKPLSLFWERILILEVQLKYVDLRAVCLSNVAVQGEGDDDEGNDKDDTSILAKALVRIEEVNLNYPYETKFILNDRQLTPIFTEIMETDDLRLKKLYLNHNDLSGVPSEVLSSAFVKLEEVEYNCREIWLRKDQVLLYLSKDQVQAILNKISNTAEEDMKLRYLEINPLPGEYVESMDPDVLKTVFLKIDWYLDNWFIIPTKVMKDIFLTIQDDEKQAHKIEQNVGEGYIPWEDGLRPFLEVTEIDY